MGDFKNEFFACQRLAVYGISRSEAKFGNSTYRELKQHGRTVIPIHKELEHIDGDRCFRSLAEISPKPDGVFINVKPAKVLAILEEVNAAGITNIWLQQGAESPEAIKYAKENNLHLVSNGCILMYLEPAQSVHAAHRWFTKVFKKY